MFTLVGREHKTEAYNPMFKTITTVFQKGRKIALH